MQSSRHRRIAVVGGGPAGATCARLLASLGARVTLLEAREGGEKPCGGGIPARGLSVFPLLEDPSLARRVVRDVIVLSPAGRSVRVRLEEGIHIFRRRQLDTFLRRRARSAGACLVTTRVRGLRRSASSHWELDTEAGTIGPFDRVIGADGVNSIVRRQMLRERGIRMSFGEGELSLGLYGYVKGVTRAEMLLEFLGESDGYMWGFPRTDHVSVGICASHRSVPVARLEDELLRFVEDQYGPGSLGAKDLRGYFIPAASAPVPVAGEGRTLIGDAGGFVDPMTREGIFHAMQSSAAAAAGIAAREELAMPRPSANLRKAHEIKDVFYHRDVLEWTTRLAASSGAIRRILAELLEGYQPYSTLKARLLRNAVPCGIQTGWHLLRGALTPPRRVASPRGDPGRG